MSLLERAREIVQTIRHISIATVDNDGLPWNTPVYFACDDKFNVYWTSVLDTQHSRNITSNPNVFLVVFDTELKDGIRQGVYIKAKARMTSNKVEMTKALAVLAKKKSMRPLTVKNFLGDNLERVFVAVPEKIWMNTGSKINGRFIGERKEIKL